MEFKNPLLSPKIIAEEMYNSCEQRFANVHVKNGEYRQSILDSDIRAKEMCLKLCDDAINACHYLMAEDESAYGRRGIQMVISHWMEIKQEIKYL